MTKEIKTEESKGVDTIDLQPPALAPQLLLILKPEADDSGRQKIKKKTGSAKRSELKLWMALILGGATLLWSLLLRAEQGTVPHLLNFQSVLTDAAGRPLADGLHTVYFRLTDAQGTTLYEEIQSLESSRGVVSAMVGAGGTLTADLLNPAVPLFLAVQVEGGSPETRMEMASVPFAVTAERALAVSPQSIGTGAIAPKAITKDLLADEVLESLGPVLLTGSGAAKVGVEANFVYSRGATVQTVLKDFDTAIHQRQVNLERQKTELQGQINTQRSELQTQMDTKASTEYVDERFVVVQNAQASVSASLSDQQNTMDTVQNSLGAVQENVSTLNALPKIAAMGYVNSGGSPCGNPPGIAAGYNVSSVSRLANNVYHIVFATAISSSYVVSGNAVRRPDQGDADVSLVLITNGIQSGGFDVEVRGGASGPGPALCDYDFNFIVVRGP